MPDLGATLGHWGYAAIFAGVVLGNLGLPVPEESILALAGYAVWRGDLSLAAVLGVGVVGAIAEIIESPATPSCRRGHLGVAWRRPSRGQGEADACGTRKEG